MARKRRGRHEGTVRKRSDGRWEARVEVGINASNGRRIQKSFYGKTKQEALGKLNAVRGIQALPLADRCSLAEYLATWLAEIRQTCAFSTYQLRETSIRRHINPYIGGLRLGNVRSDKISSLLDALRTAGIGKRTIQVAYEVLHAALARAVRTSLIPTNPTDACPKPKVSKKPVKIWTKEQAQKFLDAAAKADYYALFVLAITT